MMTAASKQLSYRQSTVLRGCTNTAPMCTTGKERTRLSTAAKANGVATSSDDITYSDDMNDDDTATHVRPSRAAKAKISAG